MIRVKNVFDKVESADGLRIWIEPIGLARNLAEWCQVDLKLAELAPPRALWEWREDDPGRYLIFRQHYHEYLADPALAPVFGQLAYSGRACNITLLHQSEDPARNTAMALREFLEVQSILSP